MWCGAVQAQDLNLQTRIESALPPPTIPVAPRATIVKEVPGKPKIETVFPPKAKMVEEIEQKRVQLQNLTPFAQQQLQQFDTKEKLSNQPESKIRTLYVALGGKAETKVTPTYRRVKEKAPRKIVTNVSVPGSYIFNTNALSSPVSKISDWNSNISPSATVVVPVGPESDVLAFSFSVSSLRYRTQQQLDTDTLNSSVIYKRILDIFYPTGDASLTRSAQVTYLQFGTAGNEIHTAKGVVRYSQPSATLGVDNVALGGLCAAPGKPATAMPCHFLNASIALNKTWFDSGNTRADNTALVANATMGWHVVPGEWVLQASAQLQGRHYDNFAGGREDLISVTGAKATWVASPNLVLSLNLSYTQVLSSLAVAEYENLRWFPSVEVKYQF